MALFERRRTPRSPGQGQALIARGPQGFLVELVDLSKGGACVQRPRSWSFNIGDAVLLFVLAKPGPVLSVEARVVWFLDDEIGLQFI